MVLPNQISDRETKDSATAAVATLPMNTNNTSQPYTPFVDGAARSDCLGGSSGGVGQTAALVNPPGGGGGGGAALAPVGVVVTGKVARESKGAPTTTNGGGGLGVCGNGNERTEGTVETAGTSAVGKVGVDVDHASSRASSKSSVTTGPQISASIGADVGKSSSHTNKVAIGAAPVVIKSESEVGVDEAADGEFDLLF